MGGGASKSKDQIPEGVVILDRDALQVVAAEHKISLDSVLLMYERFKVLDPCGYGFLKIENVLKDKRYLDGNVYADVVLDRMESPDHQGVIYFKDFVRVLAAFDESRTKEDKLHGTFDILDVDEDDILDQISIEDMLGVLFPDVNQEELAIAARGLIKLMDTDDNSEIDRHELIEFMMALDPDIEPVVTLFGSGHEASAVGRPSVAGTISPVGAAGLVDVTNAVERAEWTAATKKNTVDDEASDDLRANEFSAEQQAKLEAGERTYKAYLLPDDSPRVPIFLRVHREGIEGRAKKRVILDIGFLPSDAHAVEMRASGSDLAKVGSAGEVFSLRFADAAERDEAVWLVTAFQEMFAEGDVSDDVTAARLQPQPSDENMSPDFGSKLTLPTVSSSPPPSEHSMPSVASTFKAWFSPPDEAEIPVLIRVSEIAITCRGARDKAEIFHVAFPCDMNTESKAEDELLLRINGTTYALMFGSEASRDEFLVILAVAATARENTARSSVALGGFGEVGVPSDLSSVRQGILEKRQFLAKAIVVHEGVKFPSLIRVQDEGIQAKGSSGDVITLSTPSRIVMDGNVKQLRLTIEGMEFRIAVANAETRDDLVWAINNLCPPAD